MATHWPNNKMATVKLTQQYKTTNTQAFKATLLIQVNMSSALVDSGSSVSMLSSIFLTTLIQRGNGSP